MKYAESYELERGVEFTLYVLLMIGSAVFNYIFALLVGKSAGVRRRLFLILAMVTSAGVK